jgi:exopolysaccharide biosynthesis glucuronosyltransferase PssD
VTSDGTQTIPTKVLALASGGGHWVQLLRMRPALAGCKVVYATTNDGYRADVPGEDFVKLPNASRWDRLALVRCAWKILLLMLRERPDVVISTGAAPGYFAIRFGNWIGARTVWVDSVANVDELSLSGRKAGPHADLWLTQWQHLAREGGPGYRGSVLT